jgi:endoglucanase
MGNLDIGLLTELCGTPGLPGREGGVAEIIRKALAASLWNVNADNLGNLIAHLPGDGRKVMFVAHMDEVGLIVRRITPDGYLLVERLGGMSVRALPGSRLDLWTQNGAIPAQAGILPGHLDNRDFLDLKDIYIDIGVSTREGAESLGVRIGDGLTWSAPVEQQGEARVVGKALDDRLGCLILIALAHRMLARQPNCDLTLAFVVQEETGLMGGVPVANIVSPDVVIGVDGTLAFDTPDLQGEQSDIRLGAGPAIKLMDAIRGKTGSFVPHWGLAEKIRELAAQEDIPLQVEVATGLSTAITPLPFVGRSIKTAALSIPMRYHHTPVETADIRDALNLMELLFDFLNHFPA